MEWALHAIKQFYTIAFLRSRGLRPLSTCPSTCIFFLTIFQNNLIYESHCVFLKERANFDVRENQTMKNATKKAAKKAPAKKAAPKKKK